MALLPLRICKDPYESSMIDGATLKTDQSIRHETLLLVGDIRDAVVVTSALYSVNFCSRSGNVLLLKGAFLAEP